MFAGSKQKSSKSDKSLPQRENGSKRIRRMHILLDDIQQNFE